MAGGAASRDGVEGGVKASAECGGGMEVGLTEKFFGGFCPGFGFLENGEEVCAALGGVGESLRLAKVFPKNDGLVGGF